MIPIPVYITVRPYSSTHAPAAHPGCRCQHNCYPLCTRGTHAGCSSWLSVAIRVIFQTFTLKLASCCQRAVRKSLLTVHMQPVAIALNYSFENIRNDVHQIYINIYTYIYIRKSSVGLTHARPNYNLQAGRRVHHG